MTQGRKQSVDTKAVGLVLFLFVVAGHEPKALAHHRRHMASGGAETITCGATQSATWHHTIVVAAHAHANKARPVALPNHSESVTLRKRHESVKK